MKPAHEPKAPLGARLLNSLPVLACRLASTEEALAGVTASKLVNHGDVRAACAGVLELAP